MRTLRLAMASLLLTVSALVLPSSRSLLLAQLPPTLAPVGRPLASQVPDIRAHIAGLRDHYGWPTSGGD